MFDRIIDFILNFLSDILPFVVVDHYDRGVRLRLGKKREVLEPGIHLKWPFVDKVLTQMVKTTTIQLPEQTITTKDNKSIVVKSIIKYQIVNVEVSLLEVNDPIDAVSDMTLGIIRDVFIKKDWVDCNDGAISKVITDKANKEAEKWGIGIDKVTLTDLGLIRTVRLMGNLMGKGNDPVV